MSEAQAVAQAATSAGHHAVFDVAHIYNEQKQVMYPNNKPHYHAIKLDGKRKKGHHWFN